MSLLNEGLNPSCSFGIFANKEDLVDKEQIPLEELQSFAEEINAIFKKTSAKLNTGIQEGFFEICRKFITENKKLASKKGLTIERKKSKKACC